jgi:hypothetical protein
MTRKNGVLVSYVTKNDGVASSHRVDTMTVDVDHSLEVSRFHDAKKSDGYVSSWSLIHPFLSHQCQMESNNKNHTQYSNIVILKFF